MGKRISHIQGFTLIELSIVLVIIGLIVGGVLVGQDLIKAAEVRAQISQIEKFNTAVNTFYGKYDALPGDITAASVTKFGFQTVPSRAGTTGQGDGNGILEGYAYQASTWYDFATSGETAWFWEDLSSNSNLIEGSFNTATNTGIGNGVSSLGLLIPLAKIGSGNYVYVYSINGTNYFGLSAPAGVDANGSINHGYAANNPGLTVQQAYAIDKKVDDGYPQTGNVTALYQNVNLIASYIGNDVFAAGQGGAVWAAGGGVAGASDSSATAGTSTTCYDNSASGSGTPGVASAIQHYSLEISNGANVNCALSFRFQ